LLAKRLVDGSSWNLKLRLAVLNLRCLTCRSALTRDLVMRGNIRIRFHAVKVMSTGWKSAWINWYLVSLFWNL